jgi:hypothetical protein
MIRHDCEVRNLHLPFGKMVELACHVGCASGIPQSAASAAGIEVFFDGQKILPLQTRKLIRSRFNERKLPLDFLEARDGFARETVGQPDRDEITPSLYFPMR